MKILIENSFNTRLDGEKYRFLSGQVRTVKKKFVGEGKPIPLKKITILTEKKKKVIKKKVIEITKPEDSDGK